MEIRARPLDLSLHRPFTISRGSRTVAANILVEVEHKGLVGRGEGAPNVRYGQSQASALAALADLPADPDGTPYALAEIVGRFSARHPGEAAARCALESALWDWIGRHRRLPLCRLLSIDPHRPCSPSSFTISIDSAAQLQSRVTEAADWPILKVKLGGGESDRVAVEALRREWTGPIRVDANEAWNPKEAAEKVVWLAEEGCELVEQPLPAGRWEETARLREISPLPLVADEDFTDLQSLDAVAAAYDGVNVKLMKCGGLREAVASIHAARGRGLEVLLGCFVESSLGIAAASHLAPLARWIDLDGAALLADDPFGPTPVVRGRVTPPVAWGLGVEPV
jgi:L-alanine-DL-glutamate epimerase-like enolase superfamily enzyme